MGALLATTVHERILTDGTGGVTDTELVRIILNADLPEDLVRRLCTVTPTDLAVCPDITSEQAARLVAALELGRRTALAGPLVSSPEDAYALLHFIGGRRKEHFVALYLDSRRRLLQQETLSIGTLTSSLVHPREIYQPAVAISAAALVVGHNHPSGDPEPSPEDLALTRRLRQSGEILGIELLDHLVIGRGSYVSLKTRGVL